MGEYVPVQSNVSGYVYDYLTRDCSDPIRKGDRGLQKRIPEAREERAHTYRGQQAVAHIAPRGTIVVMKDWYLFSHSYYALRCLYYPDIVISKMQALFDFSKKLKDPVLKKNMLEKWPAYPLPKVGRISVISVGYQPS